MEFTQDRTVKMLGLLLILSVATQALYTGLYVGAPEIDRGIIWGLEGVLFSLTAAVAGSALVMSKRYSLGFSAIAFSAVFNLVQVGIGIAQFGPAGEAAAAEGDFAVFAPGVYALSFYIYNAAKILLGLAALVFGLGKMSEGSKLLGGLTALVGLVALVTNSLAVTFGLNGLVPSPVAGGPGVAATLLVAVCLFGLKSDD